MKRKDQALTELYRQDEMRYRLVLLFTMYTRSMA